MDALVKKALNVLEDPEHYDEAAAVSFFLELDRGLYAVDLKNVMNGISVLVAARQFLAAAKILLDGWKYNCIDNEKGSMMVAYENIKKMGGVLYQFYDYVQTLETGKDATLKAANLRASLLNILGEIHIIYNMDLVKLPDELKFAFVTSEATLSQTLSKIDLVIDCAVGRGMVNCD